MTPISLVEEMLDTLPNEVWSNPDLKWLDHSAGVGIFPSVIVERLMAGLEGAIPDSEKRYEHILGNMLYVSELQPKNCFLFLCGFDPHDKYDTNVYQGSYLDEGFRKHAEDVWGVDKFDIIVGNPPYQEQKEGNKKTQPLWHRFVEKSINKNLVEDGFFVMVHPNGWRNVDGVFKNVQQLMLDREIHYLNMNSFSDGLKTFGANTTYDFYCLKNTLNSNNITKIVDIDDNIYRVNVKGKEFIPSCDVKKVYSLLAKDGEETVEILHSYSAYETRKDYMSKEQTSEFKYVCANGVRKGGILTKMYSTTNENGHFGIPKVMWYDAAGSGVYVDETGEFGQTQFVKSIVDDVCSLDI
jgi:hypothetical protein